MEEKDKEKSFMQKMREKLKPKTEEKKKREDVLKSTDGNFAERLPTFKRVRTNHDIDHLSYTVYQGRLCEWSLHEKTSVWERVAIKKNDFPLFV